MVLISISDFGPGVSMATKWFSLLIMQGCGINAITGMTNNPPESLVWNPLCV